MEKYKWDVDATYTTEEMWKRMGISESTWSHKKNIYLDNFRLYYVYEVFYEGTFTKYHILKKLGDYKKPPRKNAKENHEIVYENEIIEVVKEDNVQTAANVARIIKDHEAIKECGYTPNTHKEYTRLGMRELFGSNHNREGRVGEMMDKIWCGLDRETNTYFPMTEEQYEVFRGMIAQNKESKDYLEEEMELYSDYLNELITKDELYSKVGKLGFNAFLLAQSQYKDQYGFRPIKVPVYGFYNTDILNFDKAA